MTVYLDQAAAARPAPEAIEFYFARVRENYANQEAAHSLGHAARQKLDLAADRLKLAICHRGKILPLIENVARSRLVYAKYTLTCSRLSAARFTNKAKRLPFLHGEAYIINGLYIFLLKAAARGPEIHLKILNFKELVVAHLLLTSLCCSRLRNGRALLP